MLRVAGPRVPQHYTCAVQGSSFSSEYCHSHNSAPNIFTMMKWFGAGFPCIGKLALACWVCSGPLGPCGHLGLGPSFPSLPMKINGHISSAPAQLLFKVLCPVCCLQDQWKGGLDSWTPRRWCCVGSHVTESTAASIKVHLRIILCFSS